MANWLFNKSSNDAVSNVLSEGGPVRAGATFAAELRFEEVSKNYGERAALAGLSLDIAPGEVLCLLGPSGCGKTTLLRVAAGIERPDGGRVLINGREVAGPERFVQPEARGVGLMFQDFALFPHLTILENVAFGLKALPRAEARREALTVLARVGLERYAEQYPHILSGGQQQRVALARAIVPRPAVMLMDEPFSGLDVQLRESMQQETLALLRETRATTMIVTHDPEEAMRLGDRIAVMRAGRLVQVGRAEDLYHRPAELFVARLFSEINEIDVKVAAGRAATPFGPVAAPGLGDGERATLCIRERSVGLTAVRANGGGEAQGLAGRVRDARFLGDAMRLEVVVEGFEAPLNVRTRVGHDVARGSEVRLCIDPSDVIVFPSSNGKDT
ncbi:iron ABC transporter ATP-binding protein [Hyphomicrobium nitrativorans NL23]|uniref:Iron ABC transporter ATP-binding protein n=1 Tax=Hyphomicrobium nitrativorans NL23 TaxID=1029756 RepID=V5SCG5_9HYPH|nr:ABC transporter ATP-binding protein [Hyphomicrobium nitrativorans]AHB48581.1 iron ABC transporter ATP-binding protein [Hyphomicrobium nitrativorans NL23]